MKSFSIFAILLPIILCVQGIATQSSGNGSATRSDEMSPECNTIRDKLTKNMNILESVANTAQSIQQKDCNFAKSNVKLTRNYGKKCLATEAQDGMDNVYQNMQFVSRIICENVNKRILGCFSPENLKQFNQCTNKTIQYIDYLAKRNKGNDANAKPQIRRKRFLLQNLFGSFNADEDGNKSGRGGLIGSGFLSGLTESLAGLATRRSSSKQKRSMTSLEQQCCMAHLHSDCFLNKVVHTCADKSELRMAKALQTVLGFALRDVVDIACGRIHTLDQCEKFSNEYDVESDLGF